MKNFTNRLAWTAVLVATGCSAGTQMSGDTEPMAEMEAAPDETMEAMTSGEISAEDLRTRLFAYAHDSMMGRLVGTEGNTKATDYLAREVERLGLQPAGENGTYFQLLPMYTRSPSESIALGIEGRDFDLGEDFVPLPPIQNLPVAAAATFGEVPAVYGGRLGDFENMLPPAEAAGKMVIFAPALDPDGNPTFGLGGGPQMFAGYAGAAGLAFANLEAGPPPLANFLLSPQSFMSRQPPEPSGGTAVLFMSGAAAEQALGGSFDELEVGHTGGMLQGEYEFTTVRSEYPVRNVIAVLPGSDPNLSSEYVAIGAHSDHVGANSSPAMHDSVRAYLGVVQPFGAEDQPRQPTPEEAEMIQRTLDSLRAVRPTDRLDSISNGADDDGSGSVTLLEIAEAFAMADEAPRRSILFVWHNGEEAGLLGSQYFTDNPTVERSSIVAQLNMDMIGRGNATDMEMGGPGYIQLIGSRRLSTELGDLVETVNEDGGFGFEFDYQFDADGHPSNFYCRSDHYMYARYGIPIVFFTTGSHRDYHQITDEPQYVNYDKMSRIGGLVKSIAERVANLDHRVEVDQPTPDPNAPCQQ